MNKVNNIYVKTIHKETKTTLITFGIHLKKTSPILQM